MRRHYAFESEELPSAVKDQLEKVEDAVDEKCTSVEACDEMLDKISAEQDKFNGCLKDMAGAAKDCKDGKCDSAEMAAKVSPKMAELKEVAKSIGVASEGETVTEDEVKAAKQYLEGAEEIVEAKKDELGAAEGGDDKPKDDEPAPADKPSDDDKEGCEDGECDGDDDDDEEAEEAFLAIECAIDTITADIAMEGVTIDAIKIRRGLFKEIKEMKYQFKRMLKQEDFKAAAAQANKIASKISEAKQQIDNMPSSVGSAVLVNLALAIPAALGAGISLAGAGVGAAATAAGAASFGAGTAAGNTVGSAISRLLAKRRDLKKTREDERANDNKKMDANDFNAIIACMRSDMAAAITSWKRVAKECVDMAQREKNRNTRYAGEAFSNFIEACESFMIDRGEKGSGQAPYLFD